jgi:uncharacterized protein YeaO (DUF488 family)
MLRIKRVYDATEPDDGKRILIDRLWPRGISKTDVHLNEWIKELAPSTELRNWFGHDDARWEEFRNRYIEELSSPNKMKLLKSLAKEAARETITLVYGAKDIEHNNGIILKKVIEEHMVKNED